MMRKEAKEVIGSGRKEGEKYVDLLTNEICMYGNEEIY